jgi:hypothetical protein
VARESVETLKVRVSATEKKKVNLFRQLKASDVLQWGHFYSVHFKPTFINVITQHLSADVRKTMWFVG